MITATFFHNEGAYSSVARVHLSQFLYHK